ncbi:MAG: TonB-dependent receptor [Novosphingobium sp.]
MKYLFFLTSSLVLATPALADEAAPADDASNPNADIVVLASGFEQPREETGQAISVVNRNRLDQLQAVSVGDALRTLPGMAVAKRGSFGGLTSVFIRGGNSSQTLVLIDGVRINDVSTPNNQFDFGPLLAGSASRIEVLRGPNSVVWGNQAIGGVVNIETWKPTGPLGIDAGIEYGANDTVSGHANVSGQAGILEASLGGAYYRTDGISAIVPGTERDGSRVYALNGKLKVNLTSNLNLDFRGYFNDSRTEYDNPFAFTTTPGEALPVAFNKQFVLYAGVNLDLADGRFHNRVAYTRTDIDRRGVDPEAFSYNNYQAFATIDRFEYRGAYDFGEIATLTAGAEYEKNSSYTQFETDPATRGESDVASGYAQVSLRPVKGLTLTGGVRHDAYSLYGSHTTVGGNLAYTPNDGDTVLRATYGEGFRAPTFSDSLPPYGNPNLKPETSRNMDLGIEQALFDKRVKVGATYFRRRTTDQIGYDAFFVPQNIERVHTDGLELTLEADPTPTVHIEANYTLTNSFNRSGTYDGKRLQLRPQHSGSATIDWETPLKLKLGGTLTVSGDSFNDQNNLVRIKGYALFDLRAAYPLTDKVEIYGRIENLFDTKYTIVTNYGTYGRSAFAGVRARF